MVADHATLVREADRAASAGDLPRARELLEAVATDAGFDVDTHLKFAASRRAGGDPRDVPAVVRMALAADPLHFIALLLCAKLLERAGFAQADEGYVRALTQRPDDDVHLHLATMVGRIKTRCDPPCRTMLALLIEAQTRAASVLTVDQQFRLVLFRSNAIHATRAYHSEPSRSYYPKLVEGECHGWSWHERLQTAAGTIAAQSIAIAAMVAAHGKAAGHGL